jgi:hypothetical protein
MYPLETVAVIDPDGVKIRDGTLGSRSLIASPIPAGGFSLLSISSPFLVDIPTLWGGGGRADAAE